MLATRETPYLIGIAGGTGSGKTTVAEALVKGLPPGMVALIQHDSYYRHRPELTPEQRDQINFDHPDALDNTLLVEHLDALRAGRSIEVPIYDFLEHLRKPETIRIDPVPIVIVEGILILVDEELRRSYRRRLDHRLREFENYCRRMGIEYLRASTAIPFEDVVLKCLRQGAHLR